MLGARLHYGVPRALDHAGLLGTLYTDVYIGNKPWLRWLLQRLPQRVTPVPLQRLQGRDADLSSGKVVSLDALGLRALLARRRVRTHRESREWLAHLGKDFCDAVVQSGLNSASAIYAFSGGAREIFEAAKRHGMLCFLEQTIAPHSIEQRLTQEEREKWPGWEPSLSFEAQGNALAEREQAEWALADYIFCGSVFVAASLRSAMGDGPNCCVVPYGVDREVFRPTNLKPRKDKLNVLFMGAVGLRKGVPYLLEALRRLNSTTIHCRLVGRVDLEPGHLGQYQQWAEIVGPVPRSETVRASVHL